MFYVSKGSGDEVVKRDYGVFLRYKIVAQVAAYKTGAAGYKDSHTALVRRRRYPDGAFLGIHLIIKSGL